MERYMRVFQTMLISGLTFGCCVTPCFADIATPLSLMYELSKTFRIDLLYIMVACFVLTLIIEYSVIYLLLRRRLKAKMQLFLWVLLVNAITFPAVQVALTALYFLNLERFAWLWLILIEFAVVIVEFVLLKLIFKRMYRVHALEEPISAKRAFVMALTANFASFILGAVAEPVIITLILGARIGSS